MKEVTYLIESEIDFERIVSALNGSNISFRTRKYSDSNFPSLSQVNGFASITVSEENEMELQSLIVKLTSTQPLRIDSVIPGIGIGKRKVWQTVLIAYAIIMTILCFRYWYLEARTMEDKNVVFEWSFDGTDLFTKRKATGATISMSSDANFDQNFEMYISYSKEGIPISKSSDLNEDGFYEESNLYALNGKWIGVNYDMDNDGIVEQAILILEDKDTLKLMDTNKNGILELVRRND